MDMSDIRETESRIEVKAAAVSNLLNSINRNAFGLTLEGVLGNGSYEEQKQAAYNWMNEYYELVSAVIRLRIMPKMCTPGFATFMLCSQILKRRRRYEQ